MIRVQEEVLSGLRGYKPVKRVSVVLNASGIDQQYPSLLIVYITGDSRDVRIATDWGQSVVYVVSWLQGGVASNASRLSLAPNLTSGYQSFCS